MERSSVVANCAMNRERSLTGSNGYAKELGLDLSAALAAPIRWLDLCCGTGRALHEAARLHPHVQITGLDLVDHFVPGERLPNLGLVVGSVTRWSPPDTFDLITCVHGLHYVGDKLGALARIASWLASDGRFMANLDARSIHTPGQVAAELRRQGFAYDARRRRVSLTGHREVTFPYDYQGADDQAGPNYTGQPAVDSIYGRSGC
ncbi:class I SAM-dependent methyltransferase [Actinomadura barringtoniae]|uniref:Class I SAM-dependent methyltransferase n=1 Tax=Actinomadura barringtoniae TaxID=1427535 RepID=A0A939PNW0_9ACTN|nr:class I SAM-dependent methyltransferase [Actinomadura barringtoniae]